MKTTLQNVGRVCTWLMVVLILWSVWTSAQPDTGTNARTNALTLTTNGPLESFKLASKGVWLTFGLDRIGPLREFTLGNIPLWQYLASLIYVRLALYLAKLFDYFTRAYVKKWASKTETRVDDILVGLVDGPIKVIVFVILLHIGVQGMDWPPMVAKYLTRGLTVIVAVSLTYAAIRGLDLLLVQWRRRGGSEIDRTFNDQFLPFLRTIARIFIVAVAALMTLEALNIEVKGLITGLGIGGLAFALAAQDTVANLFGAVAVFVDKPFQVGDLIRVDTMEGVVESIGLRSTRVRHPDGHLITVPNKTMGNATIINITRRPSIKTTMNIGITYDTPTAKVKEALQILDEVLRPHPMTEDLIISFNKFTDSALNLQVIHWFKSTDMKVYWTAMQELNLAIKEAFDRAQINFAFPTQTLFVRTETEAPLSGMNLPSGRSRGSIQS